MCQWSMVNGPWSMVHGPGSGSRLSRGSAGGRSAQLARDPQARQVLRLIGAHRSSRLRFFCRPPLPLYRMGAVVQRGLSAAHHSLSSREASLLPPTPSMPHSPSSVRLCRPLSPSTPSLRPPLLNHTGAAVPASLDRPPLSLWSHFGPSSLRLCRPSTPLYTAWGTPLPPSTAMGRGELHPLPLGGGLPPPPLSPSSTARGRGLRCREGTAVERSQALPLPLKGGGGGR